MRRYLITGVSGFVAEHFLRHVESVEGAVDVLGIDMNPPRRSFPHRFERVDMLDYRALESAVKGFRPDFVVHLASFSSVALSWERPAQCFSNNTNIFLNLLETIRTNGLRPRILSVGSSEEYGSVGEVDLPLREDRPLAPTSPYAVARVAQEQLSAIYARAYGLDIVITRSFNHVGTGQEPIFAVPSIVKQFAEAPAGQVVALTVGDVSVVRDFLDVRDVARAYYLLLREGLSGEVYNVCSGVGRSIDELIASIARISGKTYSTKVDPARIRPNENRIIVGDNSKLSAKTGWSALYRIEDSLGEIYGQYSRPAAPDRTGEAR